MKIVADLHTHTIASYHAYSTLSENVAAAKVAQLSAIALTDHAPALRDAPPEIYFNNLRVLPASIDGVRVFRGVELNIINYQGEIDLSPKMLQKLDVIIASLHNDVIAPGSVQDHTNAYLEVAKNPYVDIIGHCGTPSFAFDTGRVIPAFAKYHKVVEINESSPLARPNSEENCFNILQLCKVHHVPICVNSDAHFSSTIGNYSKSLAMLKEVNFPEELVLNADYERLSSYLAARKKEKERLPL